MKPSINNVAAAPGSGATGVSSTSLASGLIRAGSIADFRALAPLPKNAEEVIDRAVVEVGMERLVIVQDLIAAGLVYPLPGWLGIPTLTYQRHGRTGYAQRTMVPKSSKVRGERQVAEYEDASLPIYCTWDDFAFDARELAMASRVGAPLDVSHAAMATRNVNEAVEDQGINGLTMKIAGHSVYGLLNEPNVNTANFVDGEAWTAAGHSGDDILADFLSMIEELDDDNYPGPYNMYIPKAYAPKLALDFKSATSGTILQRLEETRLVRSIKVAPMLPANTVLMLQMTTDVVDVVQGQSPAMVSWEDGSGWERFFVVLACQIVRPKSNIEGGSGIVVGTPT